MSFGLPRDEPVLGEWRCWVPGPDGEPCGSLVGALIGSVRAGWRFGYVYALASSRHDPGQSQDWDGDRAKGPGEPLVVRQDAVADLEMIDGVATFVTSGGVHADRAAAVPDGPDLFAHARSTRTLALACREDDTHRNFMVRGRDVFAVVMSIPRLTNLPTVIRLEHPTLRLEWT